MLPEELREWRHAHNMSPGELAASLNIVRGTVYRWENGKLPIPDDIMEKLTAVLAARPVAADAAPDVATHFTQSPAKHPPHHDTFDLSTEQPHGTVIGLQRRFWREMTRLDREAWIDQASNPLTALPWPHWAHGWEWYPPIKIAGRLPAAEPHWLHKSTLNDIRKLASAMQGAEIERLRAAVKVLCVRDFPLWNDPRPMSHGSRAK